MFIRLIPSDPVSFCISHLCESLFFSEVWNWYLDPRCWCYILHEQLTFITAQPQCCFSCSRFSLCGKCCLILSWRRPPVCLCRAAWGRGVQLWSEGEEIWGPPAPKGPAVWLHVNKDTAAFLFGASDRMLPRFSVWFSSRISFKMWQWRNRYNFILQQERSRSFLRGWIIESRLLEPFGEFKWRFAAVETPGSSSVVIWNNSVWLCGIHTDFHLNEAYFRQQRVIIWNIWTDGRDSQTETKTVLITDVYVQYFYFLKHKDLFILFF